MPTKQRRFFNVKLPGFVQDQSNSQVLDQVLEQARNAPDLSAAPSGREVAKMLRATRKLRIG